MKEKDLILIIDDEDGPLTAVADKLRQNGYECKEAKNMKEAIKVLNEEEISLVVLDLVLWPSDQDWRKNIKAIRKQKKEVVIIAWTQHDGLQLGPETIKCGAKDYVEKPKYDELIAKINRWLKVYQVRINNNLLWDMMIKELGDGKLARLKNRTIKEYDMMICKISEKYIKTEQESTTRIDRFVQDNKCLDWILTLTNKRYRNHYEHQFNVGALGWFLLNTEVKTNYTLKDICIEEGWDEKELKESWWIASLLHDYAYPISHLLRSSFSMGMFSNTEFDVTKKLISEVKDLHEKIYGDIITVEIRNSLNSFQTKDLKEAVGKGLLEIESAHKETCNTLLI